MWLQFADLKSYFDGGKKRITLKYIVILHVFEMFDIISNTILD